MFSRKYYDRYLDDLIDRQYYGAKLKLKKFDTDELQSIPKKRVKIHRNISSTDSVRSLMVPSESIEPCVQVKNLSFYYNHHNPVLKNINLFVPRGKIYSLLGASGCGKTTLLRMILGQLKPMTGSIKVFGITPGTLESNIPGDGVGYMPQDLALFRLFTIEETLVFYGRLYEIPVPTIKERVDAFINLLNLPTKKRKISQLSGGQQRRVSLAVTMIHQPPLLILDEPTVGVDSLLRMKIWNYLEELCQNCGTTVIITTHYTEEARNSYRVGFIDSGIMLAEDSPNNLLDKYNCTSLEEVFLELCLEKSNPDAITASENENSNGQSNHNVQTDTIQEEKEEETEEVKENVIESSNDHNNNDPKGLNLNVTGDSNILTKVSVDESSSTNKVNRQISTFSQQTCFNDRPTAKCELFNAVRYLNCRRLGALLTKNYILFKRNPVSIILMNIIPVLQITLFCVSFARNPEHIPIAVVNQENKTHSLSNLYIEQIDKTALELKYYDDLDDAIESIHDLETKMAIRFPGNFSRYFRRRFIKPELLTDKIIENSYIGLYPDTTHAVFYLYMYQKLLDAFERFIAIVGSMMGYNPRFFGSPLDIAEPIYGRMNLKYYEFITGGMLVAICHGISMLIGSFSVVRERSDGHLERGFVAGIKTTEILLSHILFFIFPVLTQVIFLLFLTFFIFENHIVGSLWEVFLICFMSGLQGVIFGIILSIVCPSEMASLMLTFCLEMPMIFTSGVLWPIISLPEVVRQMVLWNPMTLPIQAVNLILHRGWTLAYFDVFIGFISSLGYTCVILIFGLVFFEIFK